jgi:hypothetical protein
LSNIKWRIGGPNGLRRLILTSSGTAFDPMSRNAKKTGEFVFAFQLSRSCNHMLNGLP